MSTQLDNRLKGHISATQTVKYYLHPSDLDGGRLVLNSLCLVENLHSVEVKRSFCLRMTLRESQARGPFRKGPQNGPLEFEFPAIWGGQWHIDRDQEIDAFSLE